jgi:hypothetical protein
MKSLRWLAFVGLALLATFATAQPYDEKLCTTITFQGAPHSDGCVTFHGFTLADLQQHRARLAPILGEAGGMKDSGGPYTVTLNETTTDTATGIKAGAGDSTYTGLSLKQAARLARLGFKSSDTLAGNAEAHGGKGHKQPWGKNKDG